MKNMFQLISKNRHFIYYGLAMALLLFLLEWLEFKLMIVNHAFEIYAGMIAVIFTALGIWLAMKLTQPQTNTIVIEKEVRVIADTFIFNERVCADLKISSRELEVLALMAQGMSNIEIADRLFVSKNTIKTHIARLFEKLGANRRTQAVEMAKRLSLLP